MVPGERARAALAADARSLRDPRQRGDAAADAGRAGHPALVRLAGAMADAGLPRSGVAGGRDPRLARARLQPARAEPAPCGAGGRGRWLAGRPDPASRASGPTPTPRSATSPSARPSCPSTRTSPGSRNAPGTRSARARCRRSSTSAPRSASRGCRAATICPLAERCPSRGSRYEPLRKQSRFEGSFRQRRAALLRLVAAEPQPVSTLDYEAVESLVRDGLVEQAGGLVRLPA